MKYIQNDTVPTTSPTLFRSVPVILADELSEDAGMINCPHAPELKEVEAMADRIIAAGFFGMGELLDTSTSEQPRLYKTSSKRKPGRARLLLKMLEAEAPRAETELRETAPFRESDIVATNQS